MISSLGVAPNLYTTRSSFTLTPGLSRLLTACQCSICLRLAAGLLRSWKPVPRGMGILPISGYELQEVQWLRLAAGCWCQARSLERNGCLQTPASRDQRKRRRERSQPTAPGPGLLPCRRQRSRREPGPPSNHAAETQPMLIARVSCTLSCQFSLGSACSWHPRRFPSDNSCRREGRQTSPPR
jgi:hypothetical protein